MSDEMTKEEVDRKIAEVTGLTYEQYLKEEAYFRSVRINPGGRTELTEEDRVIIRQGEWPWPKPPDEFNDRKVLWPKQLVRMRLVINARKRGKHGKVEFWGTMDDLKQVRDAITDALATAEARMPETLARSINCYAKPAAEFHLCNLDPELLSSQEFAVASS